MGASMVNLSELEEKVVSLVMAATAITKEKFTITLKGGDENIVTSADTGIQEFLTENLKRLLPGSGFLCEENDLRDLTHEYVWIIDPIDGTTNFSRGIKNCAVSVALSHDSNPVLGVVYNIFTGDLFTAIKNGGAKLNGREIKVSQNPFKNSLLCTAMSLYNKKYARICSDVIYDAYMKCNDIRRFGSCALELCYLAAGQCELYFEIRVFPWDYAAGFLILKEAGGILTGLHGEELKFDKPTPLIGANTPQNYDALNEIVDKHIKGTLYKEEL